MDRRLEAIKLIRRDLWTCYQVCKLELGVGFNAAGLVGDDGADCSPLLESGASLKLVQGRLATLGFFRGFFSLRAGRLLLEEVVEAESCSLSFLLASFNVLSSCRNRSIFCQCLAALLVTESTCFFSLFASDCARVASFVLIQSLEHDVSSKCVDAVLCIVDATNRIIKGRISDRIDVYSPSRSKNIL